MGVAGRQRRRLHGLGRRRANDAGGDEDCGQLLRFYPDLGWNDEPCAQALFFVCEGP